MLLAQWLLVKQAPPLGTEPFVIFARPVSLHSTMVPLGSEQTVISATAGKCAGPFAFKHSESAHMPTFWQMAPGRKAISGLSFATK